MKNMVEKRIILKFFADQATEVASILLSIDGKKILIDPGSTRSINNTQKLLTAYEIAQLDYIIITHYHGDHANLLNAILKNHQFKGEIICHQATAEIVQSYYDLDAQHSLKFIGLNYGSEYNLFENIKLTLYNAGHVLGSAMAYFSAYGKRLLITGDLGAKSLPIVKNPNTVFPPNPLDLIVLDGKHVQKNHEIDLERNPFGDILYHKLLDCFLFDDGNVLIFAPIIQIPLLIYCLNYIFHNPDYQDIHHKIRNVYLDPQKKVKTLLKIFNRHHDMLDTTEREFVSYQPEQYDFNQLKIKSPRLNGLKRSILITPNRKQFIEWFKLLKSSEKNDVLLLYQNIWNVLGSEIGLIDKFCNIQIKRLPFLHFHPDRRELISWYQQLQQQLTIRQAIIYHYNHSADGEKIRTSFIRNTGIRIQLIHQIKQQTISI